MKTKKEIQTEIKALKAVRPKVRPYSAFGDNNLEQLDAQVDVLENNLDNNEIYNKYDRSQYSEETVSAALDARQWIDGESEVESLAEGYPLN